ncbi:hypothetical protein [Luteolibacter soli]|uniref:Uncharacterized protein n=1 Tax=Luteolibacter soli TaxID=3135280 RepID=A0ABU9ATW9_9BACT
MKKRWIVVGIALLGAVGLLYLFSPKRDLEVALGVKRLPGSLKHERVRVDNWTDYLVDSYFEIDPADMRCLLAVRPYEEVVTPSILKTKIRAAPSSKPAGFYFFPEVPRFETKHRWEWEPTPGVADSPRCEISVSEDFSKAYIQYSGG